MDLEVNLDITIALDIRYKITYHLKITYAKPSQGPLLSINYFYISTRLTHLSKPKGKPFCEDLSERRVKLLSNLFYHLYFHKWNIWNPTQFHSEYIYYIRTHVELYL